MPFNVLALAHPALWKATLDLRRAETLAGLAGCVSGPADMPPANLLSLEPDWVENWVERAKRSLENARDEAKKTAETARETARKIASSVESGAKTLTQLPGQVIDTARASLERIIEIAQNIQYAIVGGSIVVTAILGLAFARYMGWI